MTTSRTGTSVWVTNAREAKKQAHKAGLTHCPICHVRLDWTRGRTPASPEADHIMPHAKGGSDAIDNIRIICRHCNQSRGDGTRHKRGPWKPAEIPRIDRTAEW